MNFSRKRNCNPAIENINGKFQYGSVIGIPESTLKFEGKKRISMTVSVMEKSSGHGKTDWNILGS